jgi:hypothetical protein
MTHLTERADAICQTLLREGFNGIGFEQAHVDRQRLSDYWDEKTHEGELTPPQFEAWVANYVTFVAQPAFHRVYARLSPRSRYESVEVNEGQFYRDLTRHVRREMGGDVSVSFREGCFEFECVRTSYVHPVSMTTP